MPMFAHKCISEPWLTMILSLDPGTLLVYFIKHKNSSRYLGNVDLKCHSQSQIKHVKDIEGKGNTIYWRVTFK